VFTSAEEVNKVAKAWRYYGVFEKRSYGKEHLKLCTKRLDQQKTLSKKS
jgi:hypothetical protein